MAKQKKYNFIPEHQLKETTKDSSEFTVTVTASGGIQFSKFVVGVWELNKKVIRVYADIENKTVGWKDVSNGNLSSLKNIRQLNANKDNGMILLSVGKMLKQMGITKEMLPFKKVPVTSYLDPMIEGEIKLIDLRNYAKTKKAGE